MGVEIGAENVEVRNHDMTEEMKRFAVEATVEALGESQTELEAARLIKIAFDRAYGPKWHCAVGRHFASHVSYEPNHYIYLKVGKEVILLYKSGGSILPYEKDDSLDDKQNNNKNKNNNASKTKDNQNDNDNGHDNGHDNGIDNGNDNCD